jgi:hypothetical protein
MVPVGVAALGCAACCAGPIIGVLNGIAAASTVGAVVPPLIVLAVIAVTTAGLLLRRRHASAAAGDRTRGTVELGVPDVDGVRDSTTQVRW